MHSKLPPEAVLTGGNHCPEGDLTFGDPCLDSGVVGRGKSFSHRPGERSAKVNAQRPQVELTRDHLFQVSGVETLAVNAIKSDHERRLGNIPSTIRIPSWLITRPLMA